MSTFKFTEFDDLWGCLECSKMDNCPYGLAVVSDVQFSPLSGTCHYHEPRKLGLSEVKKLYGEDAVNTGEFCTIGRLHSFWNKLKG